MDERTALLTALRDFIKQRPGLEFGNYGDVSTHRSEMRSITRDRHDAEKLLATVVWRDSITLEDLKEALRAFSGRLSWDGKTLDYCTGQYFPTEYRKAVCAVLASALWAYWRKDLPTEGSADKIRKTAKNELGYHIANRWFR